MEDKILEAKELLWENGYVIKQMTNQMNDDADECDESGGGKDCSECSCNMCIIQ